MGKIGDLWIKLGLKSDGFKRGLKDAESGMGKVTETVRAGWGKIAAGVASAMAAVKAFAAGAGTIIDFEKANSVLAGVLGKTTDEIKALSDSAEMLGRTTAYTATQVTGLQTELAKLGFGEGQIMSMQKAVLNFATALGVDLPEAAAFTGATLRTFGLRASDTEDALNVLAVSCDKSALGFSKLNTAMPIVGPVAKSIGFDIRDTATLLGVLANSGFDASSAATALRNIFLYLADDSSKLSEAIGKPVKSLPDLLEGLDKLKARGLSVGEALELTDKRAVSAFNTLIAGTSSARELRSALDDVNGAVDEKAQAQIDNVSGAIALLKSAWDGLILSFKSSTGFLKSTIRLLTRMIDAISGLFRSTRVQNFQQIWQDSASNVYKDGGKDEASAFMKRNLERQRALVKELEETSKETTPLYNSPTQAATRAKRQLKDAQEVLDGMEAAFKSVTAQMENDAAEVVTAVTDMTDDTSDSILDFIKNIGKVEDAFSEFRKQVAEEAEVMASDDEYQRLADPLEEFEQKHADALDRMTHKQQVFADMAQEAYEKAARAAMEYEQAEQESADIADDAAQTALDNLQDKMKLAEGLNQALHDAIVSSISDSTQAFTDMILGVEDADASAVFGALLQPFADMMKKAGEMIVAYETSIAVVKENMFSNPYLGIAAGAALIALGSALSSGLQSMGANLGRSSASSASAGSTGSTTASTDISTEMTIYVKGKISGKDILISGDNARNYYGR